MWRELLFSVKTFFASDKANYDDDVDDDNAWRSSSCMKLIKM